MMLGLFLSAALVSMGCGSSRGETGGGAGSSGAGSLDSGTPASDPPAPGPVVVDAPVVDAPVAESAADGGARGAIGECAEVLIGLDLNALPQPASAGMIDLYTRGQADDFRKLARPGMRVEIFTHQGATVFTARLYSKEEGDLKGVCESMAEEFVAKVPGHPRLRESGGSIITPCGPCRE